jgi:8-oxo-dGTP pyrophosphatase MutT (NUDIX family)
LLLKRSENVGEFPGHLVFPGGHSEVCWVQHHFFVYLSKSLTPIFLISQPAEVGIYGHSEDAMDGKEALNRRIVTEMFDGITREVVEETGVPAAYLVTSIS